MSVLALDEIRKKVIYQNTVDIWIAACQEQDIDWNDTEKYKKFIADLLTSCLLYTSPSPRDKRQSRMPSSA